MAKNKKDSIDSFSGMFQGTMVEQPLGKEQENTEEKQCISKISTNPTVKKKSGRPRANREIKKTISFTVLPSIYSQASEIAWNEGKSISEVISELLIKYIKENQTI